MCLLSVVITSYNREKTIERAIKSVLNQSFSDFELIIVDDRSTDRTVEIIKQIDDERIKLFVNKTNLGVIRNKYEGFKKIQGKYFLFLDSDDYYIDKNFFSESISIMENDDEVNMVLALTEYEGLNHEIKFCDELKFRAKLDCNEYLRDYLKEYNRSANGAVIIRTTAYKQTNIQSLEGFDDVSMIVAGIGISGNVFGLDKIVLRVVEQSVSVSKSISHDVMDFHVQSTCFLYDYYKKYIDLSSNWLSYQIKVLFSFYMSGNKVSMKDVAYCSHLLFKYDVPSKLKLFISMALDFISVKYHNYLKKTKV